MVQGRRLGWVICSPAGLRISILGDHSPEDSSLCTHEAYEIYLRRVPCADGCFVRHYTALRASVWVMTRMHQGPRRMLDSVTSHMPSGKHTHIPQGCSASSWQFSTFQRQQSFISSFISSIPGSTFQFLLDDTTCPCTQAGR